MAPLAQDSAVPSALVALMVFRAPAWACLVCFTSYKERTRVCRIFAGKQGPELEKCQEAFSSAFADLADIEINYDERSRLHDGFAQMTHSLQEVAAAQGRLITEVSEKSRNKSSSACSFNVAFLDAAEKMRKVIMKLKQVRACVPPCGFQDVARRFVCFGCYSKACNLPLDCPVQDLTVTRGRQAKFSCAVNFQLPEEEITYSWKFAGGGLPSSRRFSPSVPQVRTQDQSYFRDIPRAHGYLARIRPVQPTHSGTFSCSVLHDQRPVARLYFFLNVTSAPPRGEIELQVSFRKVLRWEPRETELEPWRPSLGELLARPGALTPGNRCLLAALAALAAASATLMVWLFFRWYLKSN